jgi:hypothetical protein
MQISKKKFWLSVIGAFFLGAFIMSSSPSPEPEVIVREVEKTDVAPNVVETVQEEEKVMEKSEPVEDVFAPITVSGTGQKATEKFMLEKGLVVFKMTHSGGGHFSVTLLDSNGDYIALLANEVGAFDGSKAEKINKSGEYLFDVSADGAWTISTE